MQPQQQGGYTPYDNAQPYGGAYAPQAPYNPMHFQSSPQQAPGAYMMQPGTGFPQPQGGYVPPGYGQPQQPALQPGYQGFQVQSYVPPGYNMTDPSGQGARYAAQAPIVNQPFPSQAPAGIVPGNGGWMNIPQGILNCPPGLEYLTTIDQLLVKQKVELLEAITGFETNNKFTIKNSLGQKVYWAVEENDCCTRNCCGPTRPFDMKIMDAYRNQVIHLHRPLACDSCCFPCCLQSIEVSSPPGSLAGSIEQNWSLCTPDFSIKNATGETVLKIEGPLCTFSMCGDVEFKVLTLDGTQVGRISKQWSGLVREMFTDADYFGITFPMDLDVRMKATMMGACFLIDAMFFEKSGNRERDLPGML